MNRLIALLAVLAFSSCEPAFILTSRTFGDFENVAVGETITYGVTYRNEHVYDVALSWSLELGSDFVELIGPERTLAPANSVGSDSREFRGLRAGRAEVRFTHGAGWLRSALIVEPIAAQGSPTLTVNLRSAGTVTSDPAGLSCTNATYNRTPVKTCSVALPSGRYKLTASPDSSLGFSTAAFTGCDATNKQCEFELNADKTVDVLFDH
jgi:hypothetical protein